METQIVRAEIDARSIEKNIRALMGLLGRGTRMMAVVKADGYGHGAVNTARLAMENGAQSLGVARMGEALVLRNAGIDAPILVFGYTPPDATEILLKYDITQSVYGLQMARQYSSIAVSKGMKLKIHLKVDTGMGRVGMACTMSGLEKDALGDVRTMKALAGIELEGLYTHFASADSADKRYTIEQFAKFCDLRNTLRGDGIEIPVCHAANSAGIIDLPETHLDMVRAGVAMYGLYPSHETDRQRINLAPAMELKTKIVFLKKVPAGAKLSYGMTHTAKAASIIATVPMGYADGYSRLLSSKGFMLVRGERVPIVGRVCMDQLLLDVGAVPGVALGDEVVALGRQGGALISADEIASETGTINYEVVSSLTSRIPRIWL